MNDRVSRLRRESLDAVPSVSIERALLLTEFYRENEGRWPAPLMRAHAFHHLCTHKRLHLGDGELIVGERGPEPKATPTYPEITCHSVEDLEILGTRKLTSYVVAADDIERFADEVIPYWHGRSLRDTGPRTAARGVARRIFSWCFHRVHGAAGTGAHGGRRQDLSQGAARFSA